MRIGDQYPGISSINETLSREVNTYKKFIAPQRTENLSNMLYDMSIWGTFQSIGMDKEHLKRFNGILDTIRSSMPQIHFESSQMQQAKPVRLVFDLLNQANRTFKNQSAEATAGILSKTIYASGVALGGLSLLLGSMPGIFLGATASVAATGYFLMNAECRAGDSRSIQNKINLMENTISLIREELNQEIPAEPTAATVNPEAAAPEPITAPAA